jgi:hypothetical protein
MGLVENLIRQRAEGTLQLTNGAHGALSPCLRQPRAVHDPGKIVADLAATVPLGGDCLADIALLRDQQGLAGPVASNPVVFRLVSALASELPQALQAVRSARAAARNRLWALTADAALGTDHSLVTVGLDATIVIAHSKRTGLPDLERKSSASTR